jgi:bifunctional DNase/RNase
MAGGKRLRPLTLAVLLVAMATGTVQAVREWRDVRTERQVVLYVSQVVRLHGDRAVVVLQEERALPATGGAPEARSIDDRSHARRLPVPVTMQDGASIERRLQSGAPHSLAARAIDALGSHLVRVAIEVQPTGGLSGTLVVARGMFGSRELRVETAEAIRLALDEGAPIETSQDLLEVAGVSEEEARTLALGAARGRAPEASSLPVHTF